MHISSHPAALEQKRFEAHNPLELLRMERLRFASEPAVRLTANTTELLRSGWVLHRPVQYLNRRVGACLLLVGACLAISMYTA